jgi:acetyltransferase-like isoleucine patch superfamily enzyme
MASNASKNLNRAAQWYSTEELLQLGFNNVGQSVRIARSCELFLNDSCVASNVRIDGPSVLSGKLVIGRNIHIASFCRLAGGDSGIVLEDDVGISSHCALFAVSEDFADATAFGNPEVDQFCETGSWER